MTAALILAAGGQEQVLVENIGGASSIKRLIMAFKHAGIDKIVVITGNGAESVEKHCAHMGVIFLFNKDHETADMLGSIKLGLEYLKDKADRVFISPADIPLFSAETIQSMELENELVVIPVFNNRTGHPLLLAEQLFERVLNYTGDGGLESALSGTDINRRYFEVPDEGVLADIKSLPKLEAIAVKHSLRKIRPEARLRLSGERAFFGPGALLLLKLTAETGSLKIACRRMGVSYSKAWKMIADIERQLGGQALISKQGGRQGGSSEINSKVKELMSRYESFVSECETCIQEIFERHFKGFED